LKIALETRNSHSKPAFLIKPHLRLCVVSSWFPSREHPFRTPFVPAFVRRIKKTGIDVTVVTTREKLDSAFELADDVPVYRISQRSLFLNMFRLLAELRPDIIHVHAPNFFSSFAIITATLLRIPVIATVHKAEVLPVGNVCIEIMRRIVLLLCDQIVAVSKATRQLTEQCGVGTNRIDIVYNSAEEHIFKPRSRQKARKLLHLPLDKDIILFVGRLEPVKGVIYLIQAMSFVLREREAILVIAGDGAKRSNLQHLVKNLNLNSHVLFLGNVHAEKLALYYNAADVFVLPSLVEGHPLVVLEAMASGLPIVATNIGGNNESVVPHVNGLLVPPKNSEDLSKAILTILGDRKLRFRFSSESAKLYRHGFSEKLQLTNYFSIYEECLRA